ncbi:hypothetical protein BJ165DRAFT_1519071 [Panaeolus papilionaceus]|nr:hypothetical protein BJ165DRAFT_1519071 [Panaeolus papilionaceus]
MHPRRLLGEHARPACHHPFICFSSPHSTTPTMRSRFIHHLPPNTTRISSALYVDRPMVCQNEFSACIMDLVSSFHRCCFKIYLYSAPSGFSSLVFSPTCCIKEGRQRLMPHQTLLLVSFIPLGLYQNHIFTVLPLAGASYHRLITITPCAVHS